MKTGTWNILCLMPILLLYFCGCGTVKTSIDETGINEIAEPIGEYFVTEMTLYNETRQRQSRIVEINEKESFIEMIRQILDNPDYEYSSFQNDLYYVAQIYNAFSVGEFTARNGSTFEMVNSSGIQATYRNVNTGQLMDIRTQLTRGRLNEFIDYWLDSGYYIAVETFDRSQTIMARVYNESSRSVETDSYDVYNVSWLVCWKIYNNRNNVILGGA